MKKEQFAPARYIQKRYLKILQSLDGWARMVDICRMEAGKDRSHQVESGMGWIAKTGDARWAWYQKRKVYIVRRLAKGQDFAVDVNIAHSLGCTDVKVRVVVSDREAQIVPERHFRKSRELGIIPDGGFVFPNGWVLLVEFCSPDNSGRLNVLRWKVNHYVNIAADKPQYQVLFVLDVSREKVVSLMPKLASHEALFYVDYQTFQQVPLGQQLIAPIYINGGDGKNYPLRTNGTA